MAGLLGLTTAGLFCISAPLWEFGLELRPISFQSSYLSDEFDCAKTGTLNNKKIMKVKIISVEFLIIIILHLITLRLT